MPLPKHLIKEKYVTVICYVFIFVSYVYFTGACEHGDCLFRGKLWH